MVQFNELFAMSQKDGNGHPDEGVCDIQPTVHLDELFVIRQHKEMVSQIKVCAIYDMQFNRMNYLR